MDKFIIRKTTADGTSQNTNVQPVQSASSAKPKVKLTPSGNSSYNTDFIKFGFRSCETNEIVQPQCVVCGERFQLTKV